MPRTFVSLFGSGGGDSLPDGGGGGDFVDGEPFTITSANLFGTHSLDIETIKANIEAGTVGNIFSKSGWVTDVVSSPGAIRYANDQKHSKTKSLKFDLPGTDADVNGLLAYSLTNPMEEGEEAYITWWTRKDSADNTGQWKMLRFSQNLTVVDPNNGGCLFTIFNWDPSTSGSDPPTTGFYDAAALDFHGHAAGSVLPWGDNSWYRMELIFDIGTFAGADAVYKLNRYSLLNGNFNTYTASPDQAFASSGPVFAHVIFQNYHGNNMDTITGWMDDIYIQKGSQQRVEVVDTEDWASRTHAEIQTPTSWSGSSITFTANKGSFASASQPWLHVINSSGSSVFQQQVTIP